MSYNPLNWKERKQDERLIERYGENWRLAKRCLREYQESQARIRLKKRKAYKPHSFAHLSNVAFKVPGE